MSSLAKRVGGEAIVLVVALAVAVGVTHLLWPVRFPDGASPGSEDMHRFYDRLALAPWVCLFIWIGASYAVHKLYARWRTRRDAASASAAA